MKSRRYCPKCDSFDIGRVKRSVLAKHLFKLSPKYECIHCGTVVTKKRLNNNNLVDHPGIYYTSLAE